MSAASHGFLSLVVSTPPVKRISDGARRDFTGPKYESGRNVAETAKLVRADIKAAIAAGDLPRGT